MNPYAQLRLMRSRCEAIILSILGLEEANIWWNSKNTGLDGKTPNEIWEIDPEKVYRHVCGHVDGYW